MQIPGVLDDLYAAGVADVELGVTFKRQQADVPAVGADRAERDPPHVGRRRRRRPGAPRGDVGCGIRCLDRQAGEAALKGDEYLWEVARLRADDG